MKNKKLKRWSLINIITGYVMATLFVLLVILNRAPEVAAEEIVVADSDEFSGDLFNGAHEDEPEKEIVYVDRHPVEVLTDRSVGHDYGVGVVLDDDPDVVVVRGGGINDIAVVSNPDHVILHGRDRGVIVGDRDVVGGGVGHIGGPDIVGHRGNRVHNDRGSAINGGHGRLVDDNDIGGVVDIAALDRAILERDNIDIDDEFGVDGDELGNLTLAKDRNGDFDIEPEGPIGDGLGKDGYGLDKGDLYAYNTPSLGVGAGIGAPAIGAGVGAAGLGAGIGEAVLNKKTVPALGGIGTSPASPANGLPGTVIPTDGVGGLTSGAGAGGAAGLVTGTVTEKLGLGVGVGEGKGCEVHGADCGGHHGHGDYDFDHLPKDGALHIMMHVDGSGSILSTRKQLEIMKDSLLKEALLPYYNNDEQLYNRRVTIVDGNGERTLQFFNAAAKKDNVLAIVFQDEAQPDYHMPNFNKFPEDHYLKDLNQLKSNLNGYSGLYRGIMMQVDRGRTFAKSFKEFVENSWQGSGYLSEHNLKKYYWEENRHHIKNKDGIVFSDIYHVKDEGDPQYYLNLIFEASKRVGLDLNIYGAGLVDGKYNNKID
jgi:hypothetical protein